MVDALSDLLYEIIYEIKKMKIRFIEIIVLGIVLFLVKIGLSMLVGENTLVLEISTLLINILLSILVILLPLMIFKIKIPLLSNLYLKYYYGFKISRIYNRYCRENGDREKYSRVKRFIDKLLFGEEPSLPYDCFIYESREYSKKILGKEFNEYRAELPMEAESIGKPLFIIRNHVKYRSYWKPYDFAITVLFNKIKTYVSSGREYVLYIDLRGARHAVYNNAGKDFLYNKFVSSIGELTGFSRKYYTKIIDREPFEIDLRKIPLRWASGGIIPIVEYDNSYWLMIFYRNIKPMGWNLPIGASESLEEQVDINKLIFREALEEIVLLDKEPSRGHRVVQKIIVPNQVLEGEIGVRRKIIKLIQKHTRRHRELRRIHDRIHIEVPVLKNMFLEESEESRYWVVARTLPLRMGVKIENDLPIHQINRLHNIVFIINPLELGIEILYPLVFKMDKDDHILSGEIWEPAEALIRLPVMLISVKYIKEHLKENNGVFGTPLENSECLECRYLKEIPKGEYRLFLKDLDFMEQRYNHLKNKKDLSPKERLEITHLKWLDKYRETISSLKNSVKNEESLSYKNHSIFLQFTPVVWKSIEILYRYGALDKID